MKGFRISTLITAAALCVLAPQPVAADTIGPLLEEDLLLSSDYEWPGRANVAFDGTNYLVVWSTEWSSQNMQDVYTQLVSASGQAPDSPVRIGETALNDISPSVASDGTHFFVVWENLLDVRGQAVAGGGQPMGAQLVIATGFPTKKREPAVAWDGAEFLVVWRESTIASDEIVGQYVALDEAGDGTLSGPAFPLDPTTGGGQYAPSVACGAASCLVTWTHDTSTTEYGYDVRGVLVDHYGPISASFPIAAGPGDQGTAEFLAPPTGIGFDGANYLVAYDEAGGISGTRVSAAGDVLDPDGFSIAAAGSRANLAYGDGEYLALWSDGSVYGARVSPDGEVLDPGGVGLSVAAGDESYPAAAYGGGDYLVTWQVPVSSYAKYAQLVGRIDLTPEEQIEELIEAVGDLGDELVGKLEGALEKLGDANPNNDVAAIGKLNAFIQMVEAQSGKSIPPEEAEALIAAAQAVIDALLGT